MVRLSLVNLYLHGFITPKVHEYDSLTSEERWNEYADVILANPPFMSPKGGIQPHKRFSVGSNRSEVLFVDYMAEHLTPNGRAAIIVPEGIIFQSAGAYKQLRKYLIEHNYLWAVVSLPAGAFNPYSGVKTSILLLDKALAKKTDQILFVKVEADGFDLGAQRRPIDRNDLPDALNTLHSWHKAVQDGNPASFSPTMDSPKGTMSALLVSTSRLAENDDFNLSADRYRDNHVVRTSYQLVPISNFMKSVPTIDPRKDAEEEFELWSIPAYDAGQPEILTGKEIGSQKKSVSPGDVLISRIIPHIRRVLVVPNSSRRRQIASTEWIVFSGETINPDYLRQALLSDVFHKQFMQTITGVGGSLQRANPKAVGEITIPLPPLEIQRQIVDEIAAHQRIIEGALQVVEGWKPAFDIETEWEYVKLGAICEIKSGGTPSTSNREYYDGGTIPWLKSEVCKDDVVKAPNTFITKSGLDNSSAKWLPAKSTLIALVGATIGKTAFITFEATTNQNVAGIYPLDEDKLLPEYLYIAAQTLYNNFIQLGDGNFKMANMSFVKSLEIPLPPLEAQREIVARIERERSVVESNRELIRLYEEKVKKVIERVWEG
jgi:type I restriction enzyme M protein